MGDSRFRGNDIAGEVYKNGEAIFVHRFLTVIPAKAGISSLFCWMPFVLHNSFFPFIGHHNTFVELVIKADHNG